MTSGGRSPRFSVVMPVWNRAPVVERAIASVLTQTLADFELLVVDDGSTDAIEDAMAPFASHSAVRFLRRPHLGVCAARNAGIAAAAGSVVAYLDSDNRWRPTFLERMAAALDTTGARVAFCDFNRYKRHPLTRRVRLVRRCSPRFDFAALLDNNCIDINTLVHDRTLAAEAGGWDESLARMNDWDFIVRLTAHVEPLHVEEALVDYFLAVSPNTITATRKAMPPGLRIEEKFMGLRKATITHDTITYTWNRLPEAKYYNWVRFTNHAVDADRRHRLAARGGLSPLPQEGRSAASRRRARTPGGAEAPPALAHPAQPPHGRDAPQRGRGGRTGRPRQARRRRLLHGEDGQPDVRPYQLGRRAGAARPPQAPLRLPEGNLGAGRSESICERIWLMANICADGSVVPCCSDYDASMKVGNAFRESFTAIWNSPEYAELRRRVLLEKDSLPHCQECHTSFKLARAGDWFVDRVDFNMPLASTAQYQLRKLLRNDFTYRAWRLVRTRLQPFMR